MINPSEIAADSLRESLEGVEIHTNVPQEDKCGDKNLRGETCGRVDGHAGPHIAFLGGNLVCGWGWPPIAATR